MLGCAAVRLSWRVTECWAGCRCAALHGEAPPMALTIIMHGARRWAPGRDGKYRDRYHGAPATFIYASTGPDPLTLWCYNQDTRNPRSFRWQDRQHDTIGYRDTMIGPFVP